MVDQITIKPETVKELRQRTGAGFMDCKRALEETNGDLDRAVALLRERGQERAAMKQGREAREGSISSYVHAGGRIGVLLELNCETDFVARTDDFQKLARDIAMQVAGLAPRWVSSDDVPASEIEARRADLAADPQTRGDVESHLKRWLRESVLLEQPFRDTDHTVGQLVTDAVARIGENIRVRRFVRYALGEEA